MTVTQLIDALRAMPESAVVLFEGDAGYSLIAGLDLMHNDNGMPDEVILFPNMGDD